MKKAHKAKSPSILKQVIAEVKESSSTRYLSDSFIRETLSNYKDSAIAVKAAEWDDNFLTAMITPLEYPFTFHGNSYTTLLMAPLYVSQVSYLNARMVILEQKVPNGVVVTDADFFCARNNNSLMFTNVVIRFGRKTYVNDGDFLLKQRVTKIKKTCKYLCANFESELANGACRVCGSFVMPIQLR